MALSPSRLLDTRTYTGTCGFLNGGGVRGGETRNVAVVGVGGVPSTGVQAVAVNVTVTEPTSPGFLAVYPADAPRPVASNLNFDAGETIANLVIVQVAGHSTFGHDGEIAIYNSSGCAQVVVDIVGWFEENGAQSADLGGFTSRVPTRLLDTRTDGQGPCVGPGEARRFDVTTVLPPSAQSSVAAVALNVTVTGPTEDGYLTAYPSGRLRPEASNLNFRRGETIPNLVIVKVGTDHSIDLFNSFGCTHVVVDMAGWFMGEFASSGGPAPSGGLVSIPPRRILDTREPSDGPCVGSGEARPVTIPDPGFAVDAVAVNATVTEPTASSFLTVFPSGTTRPTASNLNYVSGRTIPNMVLVPVGPDGNVDLFNAYGCTHVVVDLVGYVGR